MPSQVNGSGVSIVLTNTAGMLVPQASITIGVTGGTASTRHSTVEPASAGTTGTFVLLIV